MGNMTMIEREKLYHEVWAEPMTTVCKRYNISDVALRKRCISAEIPLPPAGHWAKAKAGKAVSQTPLPELTNAGKKCIREHTVSYQKKLEAFSDEELNSEEPLLIFSDYTKGIINEVRTSLQVSLQLRDAHPLILQHENEMNARKKHQKLEERYAGLLHRPDEYYSFKRQNVLGIEIGAERIRRLYRIVNTLLKQIEEMEGSVQVGSYWNQDDTCIRIAQTPWLLKIYEKKSKKKTAVQQEPIYIQHIELVLPSFGPGSYSSALSFTDKPNCSLEEQVGEIIYQLFFISGLRLQKYELEHREQERRWREEERQEALKQRKKEEQAKVNAALAEAHRYNQAEQLRVYAEAYKLKHIQKSTWDQMTEEHYRWLLDKADRLDPLKTHDDILINTPLERL